MVSAKTNRVVGLDIARFVAICAMVVVNFTEVSIVFSDSYLSAPPVLRWLAHSLQGRAAATFAVLAGVGLALLTKRAHASGDSQLRRTSQMIVWRRAVFLSVVGLALLTLWPGDILHYYGTYLAISAVILFAPSWVLGMVWAIIVAVTVGLLVVFDYAHGWVFATFDYPDLWTLQGFFRNLLFNGFHPVFPWLSYVVAGLWIGRLPLAEPVIAVRLIVGGLAAAFVGTATSRALLATVVDDSASHGHVVGSMFGTSMYPPGPLYVVVGSGVAAAVIGGCLLLGHRFADACWVVPLAATGRQSLTLYVTHIVIGMGPLHWLGLFSTLSFTAVFGVAIAFCVFSCWFSHVWAKRFKRGPLEIVQHRFSGRRSFLVASQ